MNRLPSMRFTDLTYVFLVAFLLWSSYLLVRLVVLENFRLSTAAALARASHSPLDLVKLLALWLVVPAVAASVHSGYRLFLCERYRRATSATVGTKPSASRSDVRS
jgi:hypothetical protein